MKGYKKVFDYRDLYDEDGYDKLINVIKKYSGKQVYVVVRGYKRGRRGLLGQGKMLQIDGVYNCITLDKERTRDKIKFSMINEIYVKEVKKKYIDMWR